MREEDGKEAERRKGEREGKERERRRGGGWGDGRWSHIAEYVYYSFMITITMVMRVLLGNKRSIKYLEVVCE